MRTAPSKGIHSALHYALRPNSPRPCQHRRFRGGPRVSRARGRKARARWRGERARPARGRRRRRAPRRARVGPPAGRAPLREGPCDPRGGVAGGGGASSPIPRRPAPARRVPAPAPPRAIASAFPHSLSGRARARSARPEAGNARAPDSIFAARLSKPRIGARFARPLRKVPRLREAPPGRMRFDVPHPPRARRWTSTRTRWNVPTGDLITRGFEAHSGGGARAS